MPYLKPKKVFRHASEYSEAELMQFQETFKRQRAEYKRQMQKFLLLAFVRLIVIIGLSALYINAYLLPFSEILGYALLVVVLGLCIELIWQAVKSPTGSGCPNCFHSPGLQNSSTYCPECGSHATLGDFNIGQTWGRWHNPTCTACEKTLKVGQGDEPDNFKVRYCTVCGILLDEQGA